MKIFKVNYWSVFFRARLKQFLNILPFYTYNKYTFFLIAGHPRTGTSLLHTYLNSHNNILSLNEPLSYTHDGSTLLKPYSKVFKAVGCKYFYEYILEDQKRATLIQLLKAGNIKVLKIHRRNYLRTYVSLRIAEKTNEWSNTGETSVHGADKRIRLTKEECLQAFGKYTQMEAETAALLEEYRVPVYDVHYEELDVNPRVVMAGVQYFLGVQPKPIVSLLVRQNPEKLHELIEEYAILKEGFKGTAYERFFE